ncbi:MAG: cobaltochelatase subunit CobN, partial [Ectothiorhodospiraceae bacterium]|nr:cobaltochelatase subunit CobN [Ectothiorhodospiraceae bacterium]
MEGGKHTAHRLLGLIVLALCILVPSGASADAPARILLLGNDTVRPGLLAELRLTGREHGIETETGYVETLPPEPDAALVEGHDLVVVFAPSHAIAQPERVQALREALSASGTPMVIVHRERTEVDGLETSLGERLGLYLSEGGARNFDALYRHIAGPVLGLHAGTAPDPIRYPERGVYHPDYEGVVFPYLDSYRNWYGDFGGKPVIGVLVHDIHIRHTLTDWIDATAERIEAAGGVPLVFYVPVNDPEGLPAVVAPDGDPVIDALLFYRVALNPEGRRKDFRDLGVPVLQGLIYRDGDEAAWRADPVGFPRGSTPFYFAMAEMAGATDPTVVAAEREGDGQVVPLQTELDRLVRRAMNQAQLARMPNADKRLGIYIYNYPSGDTNFSASNMNVPESLVATLQALERAGYDVPEADVEGVTEAGKRLVGAYYPEADLEGLLEDGLAVLLPLDRYREWLASRGDTLVQRTLQEWGEPESASTVVERDGRKYFVVPRLRLGNVALLSQPPRAPRGDPEREGSYHNTDLPFSHDYLASYAWLHEAHGAHALIHFGTHGSAEFGVGKTRGLALDDDPHAVVGELPHVYPYIVDNLAEATLAKRRLRATMISHQTPPFAPAALYHELVDLHHLVHDWETMDDGAARDRVQAQIIAVSRELDIHQDLGFDDHTLGHHFHHYLHELHNYIHAMAQQSEPIGLHTFGRPAEDAHLVTTVMQMLADDFLELVSSDPEELFAGDHETAVFESRPYRVLHDFLLEDSPPDDAPDALRAQLERGAGYMQALRDQQELSALLAALEGRFVQPSVGGDPIRNPDSLPTGRNLYGFDPSRVPTRAAFEAGAELMEGLIADHEAEHGRPPERLAFTLWSMEVMRHHGVVEGQVLTALGVRPVWNDRGRLAGVEVVPAEELGRPRVDVLLQTSGLYRDAFAGTLELLAEAAALAAGQDEPDNPVRAMTRALAEQLAAAGLDADAVERLSRTRAFSSDIGQYGLGLDGAVADVDAWSNGSVLDEAYLGRVFLDRLQHAYGPDPEHWGETVPGLNLFETQLATVDAAIFARSSNLYGLLSSDDPFQSLG